MTEPSGAPHEGGGFLMKKLGPLPIAAYVVAGAAIIGFFILRSRSGAASTQTRVTPGPSVGAPSGIQDPSVDQNQQFLDTLTTLENEVQSLTQQLATRNATPVTATSNGNTSGGTVSTNPPNPRGEVPPPPVPQSGSGHINSGPVPIGPIPGGKKGMGGGDDGEGGNEAPERILPDYVLRPPVHLDTEMTRRPPVLTSPR